MLFDDFCASSILLNSWEISYCAKIFALPHLFPENYKSIPDIEGIRLHLIISISLNRLENLSVMNSCERRDLRRHFSSVTESK